jgi:dolichol-phosphate mannosyltransferase
MDADLSHQPQFLPEFIKKIQDFDLVIGSRYIDGGSIINWSIQRKLLSKYGNLIVRNLLGLRFNDCTSGFRCYRRTVLSSLNLDKIISDGYAFLIEMLYLCSKLRYKIGQIPIIFIDREDGKSKISKKEIAKAAKLIFKLRWDHQLA